MESTFYCKASKGKSSAKELRNGAKGESILGTLNDFKIKCLALWDLSKHPELILAFAEGMMLGNYQFLKYRKDAQEKESTLESMVIHSKECKKESIEQLAIVCEAVYKARTLVNEPLSALNAEALAAAFEKMAQEAGIKSEILNKRN